MIHFSFFMLHFGVTQSKTHVTRYAVTCVVILNQCVF